MPPTKELAQADVSLAQVWPNQRNAAKMLCVSESLLSRRSDLPVEHTGARERRYRPATVLSAGAFYKRRSLNALAARLLAYAREHGSEEHVTAVQTEIDEFFASRQAAPVDQERFLREARRALPRRLFHEVERAFEQGVPEEAELRGADIEIGPHQLEAG